MKTLYRVAIELETVVVASSRDEAIAAALRALPEMDGELEQGNLTASVIKDPDGLPDKWRDPDLVPWGDDEGKTVEQWLKKQGGESR